MQQIIEFLEREGLSEEEMLFYLAAPGVKETPVYTYGIKDKIEEKFPNLSHIVEDINYEDRKDIVKRLIKKGFLTSVSPKNASGSGGDKYRKKVDISRYMTPVCPKLPEQ